MQIFFRRNALATLAKSRRVSSPRRILINTAGPDVGSISLFAAVNAIS